MYYFILHRTWNGIISADVLAYIFLINARFCAENDARHSYENLSFQNIEIGDNILLFGCNIRGDIGIQTV